MQWAARGGYLYVIQLLVSHGADPTIADSQGYNALHLVTHSSSIMPLLYLLHQPVNVDSRDAQGHTALMWAAYQGDALSVDLLLRHGASPTTKDDAGLTPLHWAVVRGNRVSIRRLIDKGADLHAKDNEGRTPRDMAVELKSLGAWKRALEEGGWDEEGVKRGRPLSERNTRLAIWLLPTLAFFLVFKTLAVLPWYTGILLAMAEFFGMHHIVTRVLLNKSSYTDSVNQTPYFAGIICGSMVWVLYCWFTRLVHQTQSHAFTHLLFALCVGLCAYNFFRAVMLDPGTCPKPASDAELKSIIEDLASEGRLNGQTFCIQCMARKPLRSKHCRPLPVGMELRGRQQSPPIRHLRLDARVRHRIVRLSHVCVLFLHHPRPCLLPILLLPPSCLPLRAHRHRCVPRLRRRLGHVAALLDLRPPRVPVLADRPPDDHDRGVESRALWVHGRPRRCEPCGADGPSAHARTLKLGDCVARRGWQRHHGRCPRKHARAERVPDEPLGARPLHARQGRRRARARGARQ
ncbi:hypothetical protein B0H10DRAFT_569190 [Mycena sp. CBHHK59/15]|nr:hypothetical protein B0H10DRAFT_569190 [Mycena sp. CBHHK59/15]